MDYMFHWNSLQHKLLDSTAVAENRITGGVGEVTGAIPLPRPDPGLMERLKISFGCVNIGIAIFVMKNTFTVPSIIFTTTR